jgi:D-aminoacyl-tRNA deacylase
MRAVVQRVSCAKVTVNDQTSGEIGLGLLVLLDVGHSDTEADVTYLVEKIAGLRIFEDQDGRMNRSVQDVGGSVLAVSQFTLYGDVRRGKRPSFDDAAPPDRARHLYELFVPESGCRPALRNRPFPGKDACRTGQRRSRDHPAGLWQTLLRMQLPPPHHLSNGQPPRR